MHETLAWSHMYHLSGLYKLCHPAIPDGKTWSKLGEYGHGQHGEQENMEMMENINQMSLNRNTLFFAALRLPTTYDHPPNLLNPIHPI